ncbi:hypothetical protein PGB90_009496 [Kerria lacca]
MFFFAVVSSLFSESLFGLSEQRKFKARFFIRNLCNRITSSGLLQCGGVLLESIS